MKKNKNFSNFLEEVFPVKDPFSRKENGIFHNFIKWLALRFSFFFYRIGISANILDTIALIFLFPNKFGYILFRLESFFDPSSGNNYQSEKASEAIINGGFLAKELEKEL